MEVSTGPGLFLSFIFLFLGPDVATAAVRTAKQLHTSFAAGGWLLRMRSRFMRWQLARASWRETSEVTTGTSSSAGARLGSSWAAASAGLRCGNSAASSCSSSQAGSLVCCSHSARPGHWMTSVTRASSRCRCGAEAGAGAGSLLLASLLVSSLHCSTTGARDRSCSASHDCSVASHCGHSLGRGGG